MTATTHPMLIISDAQYYFTMRKRARDGEIPFF